MFLIREDIFTYPLFFYNLESNRKPKLGELSRNNR